MVLAVQIDKNLIWKLVSDGAGRTDGVTPSVRRSMALAAVPLPIPQECCCGCSPGCFCPLNSSGGMCFGWPTRRLRRAPGMGFLMNCCLAKHRAGQNHAKRVFGHPQPSTARTPDGASDSLAGFFQWFARLAPCLARTQLMDKPKPYCPGAPPQLSRFFLVRSKNFGQDLKLDTRGTKS